MVTDQELVSLLYIVVELQLLSNPDLIRQTVQNPIVRQLMMNPSVLNDLITANPQANDWLKVCMYSSVFSCCS